MNEVHAFVGHSFTEDDEEVVRKFTDYFDTLTKAHTNFRWTHALDAEPKNLADKVIELLADKNVFIGICTKKERVVAPAAFRKFPLIHGLLHVREEACEWKTSDWIIQEIGLAVGKNLSLILLVEAGVRSPGGLQSNVEYISFERERPERSFCKILEMISALTPAHVNEVGTALEVRSPPPENQTNFETMLENELTPKPAWLRRDYEIAYFRAVVRGDADKASNIDQAYLVSQEANEDDNRQSWIAICEYERLFCSKGGSLTVLRSMADLHPNSSKTIEQYAKGLSFFKEHDQAAVAYEKAALVAREDATKLRLLGHAVVELGHAGKHAAAEKIVQEIKVSIHKAKEGEIILLKSLYELAEINKNDDLCCAISERVLEIDSDDNQRRFSLAYKYSEIGADSLSIFHYLRIPEARRWTYAWNNLGVEFDRVGLPAKSVQAYQKAEDMGETLAMSNLANKLVSAGFLKEAEAVTRKALALPNYHQNVPLDLANLRNVTDEENKKEAALLEKAKLSIDFFRAFGKAWLCCDAQEFIGTWMESSCELTATVKGSDFQAKGIFENKGLSLLGALPASPEFSSAAERLNIEFKGNLSGRAIRGYVSRTREGVPPLTLLSALESQISVLMILSEEGNEIRVMENIRSASPRFYSLWRKVNEEETAS